MADSLIVPPHISALRPRWTMMEELEYDLIIVGAGPSAAGLLRGILTRIKEKNINLRIAVVERGGTFQDNNDKPEPSSFEHGHESTLYLQNWFAAAHYSNQMSSNCESPTMLHASAPQTHLHSRIVDVPTGRGWGGCTNIHAGLFVPPSDVDFDSWPGNWKERMTRAVKRVMGVFEQEGILTISPLVTCEDTCRMTDDLQGVQFERANTSSIQSKRVNYFSALVQTLFRDYPELRKCVTFLSGLLVERIFINSEGRAWGVECQVADRSFVRNSAKIQSHRQWLMLRSKFELILCAGAIGSPSILLASGVGHEDDLYAAGITPWYEQTAFEHGDVSTIKANEVSKTHQYLPVGRNLRDHVLLPRIFLTRNRQDEASMSYNSIRGWWNINRLLETNHNGVDDCARFQLQLADGIAIDRMIPHFAAAPIQRKWLLPYSGWELSSACTSCVFYFLRSVLQIVFSCTLLTHWIRLRFVSINVCLMNPKSVGKVGLARHPKHERETEGRSTLSEFEVLVDPGYLSDPHDMDTLWKGWEATNAWKLMQSGECIEFLPGYCYTILFKGVQLISLVLRWLRFLLSADVRRKGNHSADMAPPSWFPSYAAEFANPYYHWFGTCAMGQDKTNEHEDKANKSVDRIKECNFVVDECLSIRGVSGLRVCDASIFPDCVTVPTALTCAALGCATSELILP